MKCHRQIDKHIFAFCFSQLIKQRFEQGCDRLTLIDKLLRLKEETEDISLTEIKGECNTIMMAVRVSGIDVAPITIYCLITIWFS